MKSTAAHDPSNWLQRQPRLQWSYLPFGDLLGHTTAHRLCGVRGWQTCSQGKTANVFWRIVVSFMDQTPSWEASHSAREEISRPLQNPKVYYHVHNSPVFVTILSQMNPLHTLTYYLFPIYSVLQMVPFFRVLRLKFYIHFSSLSFVLHAPPISSSFIW
jgi:hypothetical protein